MRSFLLLCLHTEKQLGRKLREKEKEFLRWLYLRHKEEIKTEKE